MPFAPTDRVALTGSPRAGKTELSVLIAAELGVAARHTDELLLRVPKLPWGEDSVEVMGWFAPEGPWLIEGCTVERALRKWMDHHAEGKPCDVVVYRPEPVIELTKGQETMRKGIVTRWVETLPRLLARGIDVRDSVP